MSHRVPPTDDLSTRSAQNSDRFGCDVRFSGRSAAWVRVCGDFDGTRAEQVAAAIERAFSAALLAIVDLRMLSSIDSAGLHVLLDADARALRSGRRLVVVRGPEPIDRLFLITGLAERLKMIDLKPVLVESGLSAVPDPEPPGAA